MFSQCVGGGSSRSLIPLTIAAFAAAWLLGGGVADAQVVFASRKQLILHGNCVVIGNTLAQSVEAGVPAPFGTVGATGTNTADSGPDVFWSAPDWLGVPQANTSITPAQASSGASLVLPAGATIAYARLYWSAKASPMPAAPSVRIDTDLPNAGWRVVSDNLRLVNGNRYQASADITSLVQAQRPTRYRVGAISADNLANLLDNEAAVGWCLVVIYELASEPLREIDLEEGLQTVRSGQLCSFSLSHVVPQDMFATLWVFAYDGDASETGDRMSFDGGFVSNTLNPSTNIFNSTRTNLGVAATSGLLPLLPAQAGSMSGIDLDSFSIVPNVASTAQWVEFSTSGDEFTPGVVVYSGAIWGGDPLSFTQQPVGATTCLGVGATFSATALSFGVGFVSYQWQIQFPDGSWRDLHPSIPALGLCADFVTSARAITTSGANTTTVTVAVTQGCLGVTQYPIRCLVSTSNHMPVSSNVVMLTIPKCSIADVAGLGGGACPDGLMTVDDLVYFLTAFFAGNASIADIASSGGSPTADGIITVDDLIVYLTMFFNGCP